ncbi:MAG: alpha/beta hydrolase [Bacilli bacterium]|nr:alpha/beta hydrolase [Bacilli bacterium]MBN2877746.1 alpha/beta hydrolase [Bacilli bacterium]
MNQRVIIKEFAMNSLHQRHKLIRVILPKNYDGSRKRYPVLYMHDGQNLVDPSSFSGFSWDVVKTMDELSEECGDMIIVGLDSHSTKRILEYTPAPLEKNVVKYLQKTVGIPKNEIKAEADEYGEFIIRQVKPFIDYIYRTLPDRIHTFIAGSSCGGIISAYIGLKYQDKFSNIGVFSPALEFVKESFFETIQKIKMENTIYLYHDMGTEENDNQSKLYLDLQDKFDSLIRTKLGNDNVMKIVDEGATHSEFYWVKRFHQYYRFCFEKMQDNSLD